MRIAIVAPAGAGKTTFIEEFLKEYPAYQTPLETHKDVSGADIQEYQRNVRDWFIDQEMLHQENVIFDGCVLSTYAYTKFQYEKGKIHREFLDETKELAARSAMRLDLIIYLPSYKKADKAISKAFLEVLLEIAPMHLRKIKVLGREEEVKEWI